MFNPRHVTLTLDRSQRATSHMKAVSSVLSRDVYCTGKAVHTFELADKNTNKSDKANESYLTALSYLRGVASFSLIAHKVVLI